MANGIVLFATGDGSGGYVDELGNPQSAQTLTDSAWLASVPFYVGRANDLATARLRSNRPGPLPSPEEAATHTWTATEEEVAASARRFVTVGTPDAVRDGLLARARHAGADELVVTTNVHDHAERARSFELLAGAFGLGG